MGIYECGLCGHMALMSGPGLICLLCQQTIDEGRVVTDPGMPPLVDMEELFVDHDDDDEGSDDEE